MGDIIQFILMVLGIWFATLAFGVFAVYRYTTRNERRRRKIAKKRRRTHGPR